MSLKSHKNNNNKILSIVIKSYEERYVERKSEIYYLIQISNNKTDTKWNLEKTIVDFQNLYEKIFNLYPNLPSIPKKTAFKITSFHILDKRKYCLQYFLQYCINRKDILLNNNFTDFIELKKNSPELIGNNISIIEQYNQFNLSISNFILCKNKNILIISSYDNDYISRDEILLENVLEIKNNNPDLKKMFGCVMIYEFISKPHDNKTNNELLEKNKLWEKYFLMQTKTIFFDDKKEILCLGSDDGGIYIYKAKSNGNFKEMDILAELTFHTDKVSGLFLNSDEMNIYSCSYDTMFFVTNINENPFTKSLIYNNISGFTGLQFIQEYNIFITSDEDGIILLFSYEKLIYRLSLSLQTTSLDKINAFNSYDNFIITGGNNGKICIIDISQIKDKSIREIMSLDIGKYQIISIAYNPKNDEIIIGDENGRIIIWNNKIKKFIYSWKAHLYSKVNYLCLDDNNNLWSCGDDKTIKKWKIPEKWFKEDIYLYNDFFDFNENKNQNNIFDIKDNDSISSDEDELNDWSNK